MGCFVCQSVVVQHEHHVIPRADGGHAGPLVDLCASCHQTVHNGAHALNRGKSADELVAHLDETGRARAVMLMQIVVVAELNRTGGENQNPILTVTLEDPLYMKALDMLKRDRGFTSRAALVNALARDVARSYGLLEERAPDRLPKKATLSSFKTSNSGSF